MAGHSESHVHPVSLYTRTLWWLMALLVLTVVAGYIPNVPNWLGVVIALTIAVWKASECVKTRGSAPRPRRVL